MKILNLILFFLIASSICAQSQNDSLSSELTKLWEKSSLPGFGICVVNKDKILYQNGFGYANKENKIPYTSNTVQPIASISKTFIAVAVMKAIEDGYFTFETNINDILPFRVENPNFKDDTIKVKHLVTHTSGIVDKLNINYLKGYYFLGKVDLSTMNYTKSESKALKQVLGNKKLTLGKYLEECLDKNGKWYSKKSFSKNRAGKVYEYSNIGANLAAYIVEVATGKSFDEYTQEIIIKPLKLNSTAWKNDQFSEKQLAVLYSDAGNILPAYYNSDYPAGQIRTSCNDLGNFLIEIIRGYGGNGTLLSSESYKTMLHSMYKQEEAKKAEYINSGVFWELKKNGSIGHTGGDPGVTTFMFFNPERNTGMIFFTNVDIEESKELISQFIGIWNALKKYEKQLNISNI